MGEGFVADEMAVKADAFVEAGEVRRGEDVNAPAVRLQCGAEEGAGWAFPVGARDMEDGRQRAVRIAQAVEQPGDAIEA